jgi:WD40 repeat protein
MIIVYESQVEIYNHDFNFKLVSSFESIANTIGTVSFCTDVDHVVVGFPFAHKGNVRIEDFTRQKKTIIEAHSSNIGYLALSRDGKMICTASGKGTLLRVFDAETGEKLKELRRGVIKAAITSICFSHDGKFVLSASDTGTIHVWTLLESEKKQSLINKVMKEKSERGLCEIKIQDEGELLCSFALDDPIIRVVTTKGNLYTLIFNFEKSCFETDKRKVSLIDGNQF